MRYLCTRHQYIERIVHQYGDICRVNRKEGNLFVWHLRLLCVCYFLPSFAITAPATNPTSSTFNSNTPPTYTRPARPPATITVRSEPDKLSSENSAIRPSSICIPQATTPIAAAANSILRTVGIVS